MRIQLLQTTPADNRIASDVKFESCSHFLKELFWCLVIETSLGLRLTSTTSGEIEEREIQNTKFVILNIPENTSVLHHLFKPFKKALRRKHTMRLSEDRAPCTKPLKTFSKQAEESQKQRYNKSLTFEELPLFAIPRVPAT